MTSVEQLRRDIIALSNDFGADEDYSRAGGGNSSYKHDGILYIKPSGTALATLQEEDLVPLRIDVLLDALTSDEPVEGDPVMAAAARARVGDPGGRRPSVEILFHALIEDPLVIHVHPLVANALTCNERGAELAAELLGDEAVWVEYVDPGVPLARRIAEVRDQFTARTGKPAPKIVLLGNHGIIVSGATYDEVAERIRSLSTRIQEAIDASPAPASGNSGTDLSAEAEVLRSALETASVAWSSEDVAADASSPTAAPVAQGPLIPDQIVYSGSLPLVLDAEVTSQTVASAVAAFREEHGRAPIVAVLPGRGVIAVGRNDNAAQTALATFTDALRVARDADRLGKVRVMDARERHFIENWEAEAYRRSVADA